MSQKPEWTPRVWQGCTFPAFIHMLWEHRFAVNPRFAYMPVVMTTSSILNSSLQWIQESWHGDRLDRSQLAQSPLFIIGHWRSGTTLLHELLALDPSFNYPTTYQCLCPHHFLLTGRMADPFLGWMLPSRRPMDNVAVGWNRPQEDEFALALLGQPSPYSEIAFPNDPPVPNEQIDIDRLPPSKREKWKSTLLGFLKRVSYRDPRRLILKSPPHSFRLPTILELFPDAQFIHIVRNPFVIYSSTVKLFRTLYQTHGLQVPHFRGLEERILSRFEHLYERIETGRRLVPASNFHEIRYEDLVRDPVARIEEMYRALRLGDFSLARPRLEEYLRANSDYQTNRFSPLDPEIHETIHRRWGPVIDRYDYSAPGDPIKPGTMQGQTTNT